MSGDPVRTLIEDPLTLSLLLGYDGECYSVTYTRWKDHGSARTTLSPVYTCATLDDLPDTILRASGRPATHDADMAAMFGGTPLTDAVVAVLRRSDINRVHISKVAVSFWLDIDLTPPGSRLEIHTTMLQRLTDLVAACTSGLPPEPESEHNLFG